MTKAYQQEAPFCIQVEFTEGCNLLCKFCGLNGIREKPGQELKFMTVETASRVAGEIARLGWNSRIEFAMHGEPTMNPDFIHLIRIFRQYLPRNQLMMTSNGGGLLKDMDKRIQAVFDAGLNILALDDYDAVRIVPKIRLNTAVNVPMHDYPKDGLDYSPHRRWPRKTKVIIVIEDIGKATSGSHATITNHAGCGGPLSDAKEGQRCAKPFRELGIRWDGSIAGCCNSWTGIPVIGSVLDTSLNTLWNGPVFQAMRRKLYAGERDFGACKGCDYATYRNGLLPDKLGKQTLPPPTPADNKLLAQASAKPLTKLVYRDWMPISWKGAK